MVFKKIIRTFSFLTIILFAIIGVLFVGIILHELSHKQDLQKIANEDWICALVLPENLTFDALKQETPMGMYSYTYNNSDTDTVEEIGSWTEKKAYFVNYIISIIFIVCYMIVLSEWSKR